MLAVFYNCPWLVCVCVLFVCLFVSLCIVFFLFNILSEMKLVHLGTEEAHEHVYISLNVTA